MMKITKNKNKKIKNVAEITNHIEYPQLIKAFQWNFHQLSFT